MNTPSKNTNLDQLKTVEWPKHLRTPSEVIGLLRQKTRLNIIRSPLCSKLVLQFIGGWSYLLAHVLNRTKIFNFKVFQDELRRLETVNGVDDSIKTSEWTNVGHRKNNNEDINVQLHRNKRGPLITISNHISCIDDPILWGCLLPFTYYYNRPETVRWTPAAVDICFSKSWHTTFFSLGKTFPIIRGIGLDQPAMNFATGLLWHNQWLHLFPEGRVMRDANQKKISNSDRGYLFKWGVSKLIIDYLRRSPDFESGTESEINILPFYHLGLDEILPIGWPYIPRINKDITIYISPSVIRMNLQTLEGILKSRFINDQQRKNRTKEEIDRIKLTNYLEEEVEKLIEPITRLHYENKR